MKDVRWKWLIVPGLLLSAAGGGVWFFHQDDLPALAAMGELRLPAGAPAEESFETPESERFPGASDDEFSAPLKWPEGAVPGDLVLTFGSRKDLENFLRDARRAGLTDLEAIPALGVVRVRTKDDDEARLAQRLAGNAGISVNPFVTSPDVPPLDGLSGHLRPFGDQALNWMGVPENNAAWGEGSRIAILDTGVGDHPSLANASIIHMSVLDAEARLAGYGEHGKAVASLIAGQGEIRGIAPGAEILSIQVLDGSGVGSAFDLAKGIIAAVDAGANLVNLSLGTRHSPFLQEAVKYGQARNVLFVASTGNEGAGQILYPAAYDGVVAVGAVDGNSQHVPFSNRGENISVAAPGYGLTAAWTDDTVGAVSGTSFSTPLVTGALGHLMKTMPATEAVRVLQHHANDGGPPGRDGYYGYGVIDLGRTELRHQAGIYDVALADHFVDLSRDTPEMLVSVQNRGTEAVGNILLEVLIDGRRQTFSIGALSAGASSSGSIMLNDYVGSAEPFEILSRVVVPGLQDARPHNNTKGSRVRLNQTAK